VLGLPDAAGELEADLRTARDRGLAGDLQSAPQLQAERGLAGDGSPLRYRLGELARASENARGAAEIFAEDMLMSTYALSFLVEALIRPGRRGGGRARDRGR
jgi:hypothetical protein